MAEGQIIVFLTDGPFKCLQNITLWSSKIQFEVSHASENDEAACAGSLRLLDDTVENSPIVLKHKKKLSDLRILKIIFFN